MRSIYINALLLLLLFVSCREPDSSLSEKEKTLIIREVKETLVNYYADIREKGLTAEFKYLENSPDFFWVPPGASAALTYDSVRTIIEKNSKIFKRVENSWDTISIIPANKELIVYTGRLHSTLTDSVGNVTSFRLVETGVMVKRNDGWKLLSGQTTLVQN